MQARQSAEKLNIRADSLSIGGLSAGGHMTAVMSHMAKNEGVRLKLALMVVPSTDLRFDISRPNRCDIGIGADSLFSWSIGEEPLKSEVAKEYPSVS